MSPRHAPWAEASDFAIGLRPIAEADWLEGGEADPAARKDPLYAVHRDLVWGEVEGSRPGQAEAATLIDAALGSAPRSAEPPLYVAARRVADDLVLMEPRAGGWTVTALSLSAPTFFTARDALGKSLADLHRPVTGFHERLLGRTVRIFDALRPGLVLERRNWTLTHSGDLFTPYAAPVRAEISRLDPAAAGRSLRVRVERQTLRRLPQTGGVLFTIRVWLDRLDSLNPDRRAAFARAWRDAPEAFRAYKGLGLYDRLVEDFLADRSASPGNGA